VASNPSPKASKTPPFRKNLTFVSLGGWGVSRLHELFALKPALAFLAVQVSFLNHYFKKSNKVGELNTHSVVLSAAWPPLAPSSHPGTCCSSMFLVLVDCRPRQFYGTSIPLTRIPRLFLTFSYFSSRPAPRTLQCTLLILLLACSTLFFLFIPSHAY
jgi:hypothetical protein